MVTSYQASISLYFSNREKRVLFSCRENLGFHLQILTLKSRLIVLKDVCNHQHGYHHHHHPRLQVTEFQTGIFHCSIYIPYIQHPLKNAHCAKMGEERTKEHSASDTSLPAAFSSHTKHSVIPEVSILHSLFHSLPLDHGLSLHMDTYIHLFKWESRTGGLGDLVQVTKLIRNDTSMKGPGLPLLLCVPCLPQHMDSWPVFTWYNM